MNAAGSREAGPEMMKVLIDLASNSAADERVRSVCAVAVLDRGGVKPIDRPEAEPEQGRVQSAGDTRGGIWR